MIAANPVIVIFCDQTKRSKDTEADRKLIVKLIAVVKIGNDSQVSAIATLVGSEAATAEVCVPDPCN